MGGGSLRSHFYYRVLGLAPAARPRREHFVFAKKRSALFLSRENLQAIGVQPRKPGLMRCRALELFTRKKTSSEPYCSLIALAPSRRASGPYSLRPLLKSRVRWFLPSRGAPGATFMPLPVLPVVLLSLSCLVLHGSEGSARARTLGVHLCSTYGCSVGLWLVGWCVVLLMRYLGIVWGPGYPREGCIPHRGESRNVTQYSKRENVKT